MPTLHVVWQRLVDDHGQTCDRCGATEASVETAVEKLSRALAELDIEVVLEKRTISPSAFRQDPLASNRIWIAGEPLETWLSASSGQSRCCDTCGDRDCRTLTIDGQTYEAVPVELIVKAGLLAGAQSLHDSPQRTCCTRDSPSDKTDACC